MLHIRALGKRILCNDLGRRHEPLSRKGHAAISTAGTVAMRLAALARLPSLDTARDVLDNLVLPQVVNDPIRHGEHDVAHPDVHHVDDGVVARRVGAVSPQLPRAVEPVPLLLGLVDELALLGPQHHDLAVAEVRNVYDGRGGRAVALIVELRAAGGRRALPVVGLRRGLDGSLVGFLQVGDGIGLVACVGAVAGGQVALERRGPEVQYQSRPQAASC